jgi:hypothetical protein
LPSKQENPIRDIVAQLISQAEASDLSL